MSTSLLCLVILDIFLVRVNYAHQLFFGGVLEIRRRNDVVVIEYMPGLVTTDLSGMLRFTPFLTAVHLQSWRYIPGYSASMHTHFHNFNVLGLLSFMRPIGMNEHIRDDPLYLGV